MIRNIFSILSLFLILTGSAESRDRKSAKQIPVLAWYGIPADETTLERYLELKESGITCNLSFFPDAESMARALDVAKKAGIKMIVSCPELKTDPERTVKRFRNHPAVMGYMLRDEPCRTDFAELGEWTRKIRAADDTHFCYLNLFPNYANEQQLGTGTYREHVDLFIQEVPVQIISFDHYPVIGEKLRPEWYENLEIIAEAAKKAGKPFWAFALAVAHGPYPVPTIAELRLQVFSDLAYGAQGIQYFTYWTPGDTAWNFHNGPITANGRRSEVYDRIKVVNEEIKNLSPVFLGAKVVSVTHTGAEIPAGTKPLVQLPVPIKVLETEGKGAVISELENGNYSYLVIVNRDFRETMKLTLEYGPGVVKILKTGSAVPAGAYEKSLVIDPGDMAVYRWKGK